MLISLFSLCACVTVTQKPVYRTVISDLHGKPYYIQNSFLSKSFEISDLTLTQMYHIDISRKGLALKQWDYASTYGIYFYRWRKIVVKVITKMI